MASAKYARIYALGKERVQVIDNKMAQGLSMYKIARMIQHDWKEFQDVAEKTLVQQLNRYKADKQVPTVHQGKDDQHVVITAVVEKVNAVDKMYELVQIQRDRIIAARQKEKDLGGVLMKQVNTEIVTMANLLKDVQKMHFDLGIDQFRGPMMQGGRMVQTETKNPDGSVTTTTVREAVQMAMEVLESATSTRGNG